MTGLTSDVLVVGSGLGGLTAALRADSLGHRVTLLTKGALEESNSRYAQGGIAAAMFDDDSPSLHVEDTLVAGAGLSVLEAVQVLCGEGPSRIQDLVRWGVVFDGGESGWDRGLEAAHSRPRVLHAGGDATGAVVVAALTQAIRSSGVTVVENAFVTDLLVVPGSGRVVGVEVLVDGARTPLRADAVVLATGGAGQLYEHTTNPLGATGDGLAAAWRAGAEVDDLEFYQFHPTALAAPGNFLISEAVRGEGAVLLDAGGRRFMAGVDRRAELAPRDIVARGIADMMSTQAGMPALLDATALGATTLTSRFPTITAATRAAGFDWTREPVPVTPAAHYFMGGVTTDLHGRTSLPGLYAVGEVASTGVHGANRLASNSLLEAAVFGWRVVDAMVADGAGAGAGAGAVRGLAGRGDGGELASIPESPARPAFDRSWLQRLMWADAGVERSGDQLRAAASALEEPLLAQQASCAASGGGPSKAAPRSTDSPAGAAAASPAGAAAAGTAGAAAAGTAGAAGTAAATASTDPADPDSIHALETANLVDVARLVVAGALARRESRGAHFRTDFPTVSADFAHRIPWAREVSEHAHR